MSTSGKGADLLSLCLRVAARTLDSPAELRVLVVLLSQLGQQCTGSGDGGEGTHLVVVAAPWPDAIVTATGLSKSTVQNAVRRLRAQQWINDQHSDIRSGRIALNLRAWAAAPADLLKPLHTASEADAQEECQQEIALPNSQVPATATTLSGTEGEILSVLRETRNWQSGYGDDCVFVSQICYEYRQRGLPWVLQCAKEFRDYYSERKPRVSMRLAFRQWLSKAAASPETSPRTKEGGWARGRSDNAVINPFEDAAFRAAYEAQQAEYLASWKRVRAKRKGDPTSDGCN